MSVLGPAGIALVEAALLAGGAAGAAAFTTRVSRRIPRSAALMAAVAAWVVLFGLVPFAAFATLAPRVGEAGGGLPTGGAALVLNLVPFALVVSPVAGFLDGLWTTRGHGSAP